MPKFQKLAPSEFTPGPTKRPPHPSFTEELPAPIRDFPRVSAAEIQRRPGALTRYMLMGTTVLMTHYDIPVGIILPVNNDLPFTDLDELYTALTSHWKQIAMRGTPDDFTPQPRKSRSKKNVAPVTNTEE